MNTDQSDQKFLSDMFKERWAQYRHLEILRKDHLNIFLIINGAIIAFQGFPNTHHPELAGSFVLRSALLISLMQIIAAMFYIVARINEESKRAHGLVCTTIYEKYGSRLIIKGAFDEVAKRDRTTIGWFLERRGVFSVTKIMLSFYIISLFIYWGLSIGLLRKFHFDANAHRYIGAWISVFLNTSLLVLCLSDFFPHRQRRTHWTTTGG